MTVIDHKMNAMKTVLVNIASKIAVKPMLSVLTFMLVAFCHCKCESSNDGLESKLYEILSVHGNFSENSTSKVLQMDNHDKQRCSCRSLDVYSSYQKSYWSMKAHVTNIYEKPLPGHNSRLAESFAVREYRLFVHYMFKGPEKIPSEPIRVQAYVSRDLCGLTLLRRTPYVLNLPHPRTNSIASAFDKGVFVLNSCQGHFRWDRLNSKEQNFLLAHKK